MNKKQLSEWKELRLKAIYRDDNKCVNCLSDDKLHVHHTIYDFTSENIRIVPLNTLITLCELCHNELHRIVRINKIKNYNTVSKIKKKLCKFTKLKSKNAKLQYSFLSEKDRLIQEKYDRIKEMQGEKIKKFKSSEIKKLMPIEIESKYGLIYAKREREKNKKKSGKIHLTK